MQMNMQNKGFTLIELLVVIAIIGLLSSLAVVSLGNARDKAYDAQIKSDLSQVRTYAVVTYETGDFTAFVMSGITPALKPPACSSDTAAYQLKKSVAVSSVVSAWVAYAHLCGAPTTAFCVDSTGQATMLTAAETTAVAALSDGVTAAAAMVCK